MKWNMVGMTLMAVFGITMGSISAAEKAVERVNTAAKVLDEVMGTPEHAIPSELFNKCQCVAIIPGVKKAGLGLGGASTARESLVAGSRTGVAGVVPPRCELKVAVLGFRLAGALLMLFCWSSMSVERKNCCRVNLRLEPTQRQRLGQWAGMQKPRQTFNCMPKSYPTPGPEELLLAFLWMVPLCDRMRTTTRQSMGRKSRPDKSSVGLSLHLLQ